MWNQAFMSGLSCEHLSVVETSVSIGMRVLFLWKIVRLRGLAKARYNGPVSYFKRSIRYSRYIKYNLDGNVARSTVVLLNTSTHMQNTWFCCLAVPASPDTLFSLMYRPISNTKLGSGTTAIGIPLLHIMPLGGRNCVYWRFSKAFYNTLLKASAVRAKRTLQYQDKK